MHLVRIDIGIRLFTDHFYVAAQGDRRYPVVGDAHFSADKPWPESKGEFFHPDPEKSRLSGVLALKGARNTRREIGEYSVTARAFEGHEAFQHDPVAIDPSGRSGGLYHRVLTGDLVGEGRNLKAATNSVGYIEVGTTGFNHNDICTFLDI